MRILFTVMMIWLFVLPHSAQRQGLYKLSPRLREMVLAEGRAPHAALHGSDDSSRRLFADRGGEIHVCAFIKISGDGSELLASHGCKELARFGQVYIADIPVTRLRQLADHHAVKCIEANGHASALMDTTSLIVNATPAHEGCRPLPQAFTGQGVVMGIMDIGFDLTHPTFFDAAHEQYRIKRLWDQISPDTEGSPLYVGRDYQTQDELLTLGRSYDGLIANHGTHTLATAGGSGAGSPYRGVAYESDLCVVANATNENAHLIPSSMHDRYTYAVDALGFKYIFDYADQVGKPCVISFSEGSVQDFLGYDQLYYEVLDSLTGPGHIIVASAGNASLWNTYFHKARGEESAGTFLYSFTDHVSMVMKSRDDFDIKLVAYRSTGDTTMLISTRDILQLPDSQYVDTTKIDGRQYVFHIDAYPSCYDAEEMVYDAYFSMLGVFGASVPVSIEIIGREADVEAYKLDGYWVTNDLNPHLVAGAPTHNINSPSSAPAVICVGATSYRTGFTNHLGHYVGYDQGTGGQRGYYSSVGPTFDGRTKPDVMAPGTNIVAAANSFFNEANPTSSSMDSDISYFEVDGRTYGWHSKAGTSMSSPIVGGAVALWLQAKPDLTPDEVRAVFSRTCRHHDTSQTYPNNEYGYGEIDVYRGLLDILEVTDHVPGLSLSQPQAVRVWPQSGRQLCVAFDEAPSQAFSVTVYSLSGQQLLSQTLPAGQAFYTIEMPLATAGVVVVQVTTGRPSTTGSTLVRINR